MVSFFAKNEVGRYFIAKHPVNLNCTPRPRGVKENFVRFSEFSKILQKISCEVLNLAIFCIVGILLKTSRGFGVRKMFGCYLFFLILLFLFFFLFMKEKRQCHFALFFHPNFHPNAANFLGNFQDYPLSQSSLTVCFLYAIMRFIAAAAFIRNRVWGGRSHWLNLSGSFRDSC